MTSISLRAQFELKHLGSATANQGRDFLEEFNNEQPHQALDMKRPVEVYISSSRPYRGLPELDYPSTTTFHVTYCGRICLHRKKINVSTVFAGQAVGIKEVEEGIWLASFMRLSSKWIISECAVTAGTIPEE